MPHCSAQFEVPYHVLFVKENVSIRLAYTDSVAMVRFLRDFAYDNVADNRYAVFGRSETEACEIL